jgi:hypothetical protein
LINCGFRIADCGLSVQASSRNGPFIENPQSEIRNPQLDQSVAQVARASSVPKRAMHSRGDER